MLFILTAPAAPAAPPSSLNVTGVTASTITVQWGMLPCSARNVNITGYLVTYYTKKENGTISEDSASALSGSGEVTGNGTTNIDGITSVCKGTVAASGSGEEAAHTQVVNVSTGLSVTLTGLKPSTHYSITVGAYNSVGIGPPSEPLIVQTYSEFYTTL